MTPGQEKSEFKRSDEPKYETPIITSLSEDEMLNDLAPVHGGSPIDESNPL